MATTNRRRDILRWLLLAVAASQLLVLAVILFAPGHGFDVNVAGLRLKAHRPTQPALILAVAMTLRWLLAMGAKEVALVLGSVVFSLGLAEAGLRIVDLPVARSPELAAWRQPSPTLGYGLIPGQDGRGYLGTHITVNASGLRDHERPLAKPPGQVRILAIGDSFTFGYGLPADQTLSSMLEQLLAANGHDADVINAGVPGYSFFHAATFVTTQGLAYDPDLVVYFFYYDDIQYPHTSADIAAQFAEMKRLDAEDPARSPSGFRPFLGNLAGNALSVANNWLRPFLASDWVRNVEARRDHVERYMAELAQDRNIAAFQRNLADLASRLQAEGRGFLLVIIPDSVELHNPPAQRTSRMALDTCGRLGLTCLDMTPSFEAESDANALYLFPFDAHTSAQGNTRIAKAAYEAMQPLLPPAGLGRPE
ncbi:MAG: GDSL-type esterase/lipase family protein [Thermodesulfobacteriota bacterium]